MSTTKKPVRRGRQKKQILDQEDLQKHEELEKAYEQGKQKADPNDIFDTAKLDKNYFVRHENKSSHHQSEVFNFDDDNNQPTQQNNRAQTKEETEMTEKSSTVKKRDYRRRKKNQNIFDDEDQNYLGVHSEIKQEQNTNAELLTNNEAHEDEDDEEKTNPTKERIHREGKRQESTKEPQQAEFKKQSSSLGHEEQQVRPQPKKSLFQKNQQPQEQQEEDSQIEDDFNNVIKQKEEQSEEDDERMYILHKEIQKLPKEQRKQFYYRTLPKNHVSYAYFKRFSSGLSEIYQLCGQDHRPLLFCENQRGCIGANYYISMTKQMDKNKASYLGKLRGNASGSIYLLYDDGLQPKNQLNRLNWRVSMAAIEYENNFMGMNGPRKIKAITPNAKLLEDADTFKLSQQESLLSFQPPIISKFRNKTPKWNERLKSYALNFGGRVKLASIKNFILIDNEYDVDDEDEADSIIVFGKVDENTFSLEYRHPLSLYQAFGIVMSEFDFKINCE